MTTLSVSDRARELLANSCEKHGFDNQALTIREGTWSNGDGAQCCLDAIEEALLITQSTADRVAELEAANARLRIELEQALHPRFGEAGYIAPKMPTHEYVGHPKYPWFCKLCGYPAHEPLRHPQGNDAKGLSDEG